MIEFKAVQLAFAGIILFVISRTIFRGYFSFYKLGEVTRTDNPQGFWLLVLLGVVISALYAWAALA